METNLPDPHENENQPSRTCPACQAVLPADVQFCIYCGHNLSVPAVSHSVLCPRCSSTIPSDSKFCVQCGLPLAPMGEAPAFDEPPQPSSREYYLATDGLFPKEEGDTLTQRFLPALFILMASGLGLVSVIVGVLLLGPFLDLDDDSTSLILQIFADVIPLVILLTPGILARFGLTNRSIGMKEDLNVPLALRTYLALTLIVFGMAILLQILLSPIYIFFDTSAEETSPYPDVSFLEPDFLLLWILVAVIIGPIYEEVLARGYLIPLLEKRGCSPVVAILGSSAIFSGLHLQADLLAMFDEGNTIGAIDFPISHGVSTFVIGLIFGTIYYASGRSLKTCILLHSINNGVATILLASGESDGELQLWLAFFLFMAALIGGGYTLYTNRHLFSREYGFVKQDFRGFESAATNYIVAIAFVAFIPLVLLFLGGVIAYFAWYVVGAAFFVIFWYKTRTPNDYEEIMAYR
ncbi:MAG: CPBP family glutamic-type intramembrane protease [Candidatus Hodarchaeales archaeon]